jgi:transcription initiation factor TFIIH subunit 4
MQNANSEVTKGIDSSLLDLSTASSKDKFLIVETNFKVYAYTSSPIYRELFKRFMRVEYTFPNLITATITRDKLQKAF